MPDFKINPAYSPVADQPQARKELAGGIDQGDRFQTLLGVTGSGKTATMAFTIEQVQRPALVIAHNKTLAAQLCNEFRELFPKNSVEYFVSYYDYYQPEAYPLDRHLHREGLIPQRGDRPPQALRHQRPADQARRHHRGLGERDLRRRLAAGVPRAQRLPQGRR